MDYCRVYPEELDGFLIETKINERIAREMKSVVHRVDMNIKNVHEMSRVLQQHEASVEASKTQHIKFTKFESMFESVYEK